MNEQEFQENPAGAYVHGVAQKINEHHNKQDNIKHAKRERHQRLGWAGRLKEAILGRQDDDDLSATAVVSPPSGPQSPPRFVEVEAFEDDEPGEEVKLSPEARLKQRRIERIEGARVGRPFHETVMLFFLKAWLLVGPIAFVCLTAAEVAYILTHLVAPGDQNGQVIIWAGALFIELAMMFTTFGVGIKRHAVAERKEAYGYVEPGEVRMVWLGTAMWLAFALINIIGQTAFLGHIIQASQNPNTSLLWVFVASRVIGFILGDAGTAFFLGHVDENNIQLLAKAEREKGKLYADLTAAESQRKLLEAEADTKIQLLQIDVEQKRADADFLASLKKQSFTRILEERPDPMLAPSAQQALPAPNEDAPLTGEFHTLRQEESTNQVRVRRLDRNG